MNPDMEALLRKMQSGESVQKKWLGQYAVYAALVISYEGLVIQREQLQVNKKIESHLAKLAGTVFEKTDYRARPEVGVKAPIVKALRTAI